MRIRKFNNAVNSISSAALLLGAAGLLSRILGILRDRLLAGHFGAGRELDIYYAAFQIPDFVYNIFLLGAASAAIIPIFLETKAKSEEDAKTLVRNLLGIFVLISAVIAALTALAIPVFIGLVTPGFSYDERSLTVVLTRIMMISPVLLGISGIISAVTQSFRRFAVFALSPVVYNIGIIFGILVLLPAFGLSGLALGVIIGAVLHLAVQLYGFFDLGFNLKMTSPRHLPESVIKIMKLSFPRVIASSINNLTAVFLVAISSTLVAGSIAVYQFANNLGGLPIGIFGVSFAIAAFPSLSENFIKKDAKAFFDNFYSSVRSILFYIFPISVFFYVLRAQIVRATLGTGKFDWGDTRLTAASLGIMTIAIFAHSLIPILIRFFYALGNTKRPLIINLFTAALTIVLALVFVNILSAPSEFTHTLRRLMRVDDLAEVAVLGVALAISVGALTDLVFLTIGAFREADLKFGGEIKKIKAWPWRDTFLMLGSSLAAGFAAFGGLRLANRMVTLDTLLGVLLQSAVAFFIGSIVYLLVLYMFKNRETLELVGVIKRRAVAIRIFMGEMGGEGIK
ncbi:MAG: murein biosynthesis integral membrane protein MurJ [bacterium]|nr:murein biosynthesis integral membrane protein MurJ [bacterium]